MFLTGILPALGTLFLGNSNRLVSGSRTWRAPKRGLLTPWSREWHGLCPADLAAPKLTSASEQNKQFVHAWRIASAKFSRPRLAERQKGCKFTSDLPLVAVQELLRSAAMAHFAWAGAGVRRKWLLLLNIYSKASDLACVGCDTSFRGVVRSWFRILTARSCQKGCRSLIHLHACVRLPAHCSVMPAFSITRSTGASHELDRCSRLQIRGASVSEFESRSEIFFLTCSAEWVKR